MGLVREVTDYRIEHLEAGETLVLLEDVGTACVVDAKIPDNAAIEGVHLMARRFERCAFPLRVACTDSAGKRHCFEVDLLPVITASGLPVGERVRAEYEITTAYGVPVPILPDGTPLRDAPGRYDRSARLMGSPAEHKKP